MTYFDRLTPSCNSKVFSFTNDPRYEQANTSNFYNEQTIQDEFYNDDCFKICFSSPRPPINRPFFSYQQEKSPIDKPFGEYVSYKKQHQNRETQLKKCRPEILHSVRQVTAPGINKEFYTNLLHISHQDILAVAIQNKVTIMPKYQPIYQIPFQTAPSCLHWLADSNVLFTGVENGHITLHDVTASKRIYQIQSGEIAIPCAASTSESLYFGNRSGQMIKIDPRAPSEVTSIKAHSTATCSLALSPDATKIASGGDDNLIHIWDSRIFTKPLCTFREHGSAVKALAWAPWKRNLLFSGGGEHDRTIKAISVAEQRVITAVSTDSPVTSIHMTPHQQKLISCHGYDQNASFQWSFADAQMSLISHLQGHTGPVLHSSLSADKTLLVTASPDETIRFWNVFRDHTQKSEESTSFDSKYTSIR